MNINEIRKRIIICLENIGFVFFDNLDDINLSEYISDSVEFVQFLVELEEEFNIEIPDDLLGMEILGSINGLSNMIIELIETKEV